MTSGGSSDLRSPEAIDVLALTGPPRPAPLVPELLLHQVDDLDPLWARMAAEAGHEVPPPFWAFCWPGGLALARYVLDNPSLVAGKRVFDLASGGGLDALAAAYAGAASVVANDIDPAVRAAVRANAAANSLEVDVLVADVLDRSAPEADVVLVGDSCYEPGLAERVLGWVRRCNDAGIVVLMGDPRRTYFSEDALEILARYDVPVSKAVEGRTVAPSVVCRVVKGE